MVRFFSQYNVTTENSKYDKLGERPGQFVNLDDEDLHKADNDAEKKAKKLVAYEDLLANTEKHKFITELQSRFDPLSNRIDRLCLKNIVGYDLDNKKMQEIRDELRSKVVISKSGGDWYGTVRGEDLGTALNAPLMSADKINQDTSSDFGVQGYAVNDDVFDK